MLLDWHAYGCAQGAETNPLCLCNYVRVSASCDHEQGVSDHSNCSDCAVHHCAYAEVAVSYCPHEKPSICVCLV